MAICPTLRYSRESRLGRSDPLGDDAETSPRRLLPSGGWGESRRGAMQPKDDRRKPASAADYKKLVEADPRRALSPAGLKRIRDSIRDGDILVLAALAEAKRENKDLDEAEGRANVAKARLIVRAAAQEYLAIGKRGEEFEEIMCEEIDGAANSGGLNDFEREQLRIEAVRDESSVELVPIPLPPALAAKRQAWMEARHPGWSLVAWRDHTGLAYDTLKKYKAGVQTTQTRSVRRTLAEKEMVVFSTVPE